jgi:uncharacterized protein (DUF433 family)
LGELIDIYGGKDPRDIPTYSAAEVARYLRVPASTVRSWVFGCRSRDGKEQFKPVITLPDPQSRLLSFTNLIEGHVLKAIRRGYNVRMDKVRLAIETLESDHQLQHPLAEAVLHTDGQNLFIHELGNYVNVSQADQLQMQEVLMAHIQRIEIDAKGLASKLYPLIRLYDDLVQPKWIVIDPHISFGRPVLADTGIPVGVVVGRYSAGESIDDLAEDFGCERLKIEEAIRAELPPQAA